jgi:pyrrolidone-carboxylate peptidase
LLQKRKQRFGPCAVSQHAGTFVTKTVLFVAVLYIKKIIAEENAKKNGDGAKLQQNQAFLLQFWHP